MSTHDIESAGATPYWCDVPMLTRTRANVISEQLAFPVSHEQFSDRTQASFVSHCTAEQITALSSEKMDSQLNAGTDVTSRVQPTSAAEASAVTHILSTGQKKRVGVFLMFCCNVCDADSSSGHSPRIN